MVPWGSVICEKKLEKKGGGGRPLDGTIGERLILGEVVFWILFQSPNGLVIRWYQLVEITWFHLQVMNCENSS